MDLNYENIEEFFYTHTVSRLSIRKKLLDITNKEIAGYKVKWVKIQDEYIDYTGLEEHEAAKYEKHYIKNEEKVLDEKIVSKILNNNRAGYSTRSSPNQFLIPPSYVQTLITTLKFEDKNSMFWGEEWEVETFAGEFFKIIFETLLASSQYKSLCNALLIDYIPFSYNKNLRDIIWNQLNLNGFSFYTIENLQFILSSRTSFIREFIEENFPFISDIFFYIIHLLDLYNLVDHEISQVILNIKTENFNEDFEDAFREKFDESIQDIVFEYLLIFASLTTELKYFEEEAIGKIYLSFKLAFIDLYKDFFYKLDNFKSLPKYINIFINEKFIPLITNTIDLNEFIKNSLGHRVENIMKTDLVQLNTELLLTNLDNDNRLDKAHFELVNASKTYINKLKHHQFLYDKSIFTNEQHNDAEWFYFQSIQNKWHEDYRIKNNYLSNKKNAEYK